MEKRLTVFSPNHINQYNIHLYWLKCQLSAKSNLFHVSDHNTKLIEFHVNETAGVELLPSNRTTVTVFKADSSEINVI